MGSRSSKVHDIKQIEEANSSLSIRLLSNNDRYPRLSQSAPLDSLNQFIKELKRKNIRPERVASRYLKLYAREAKFIVNPGEVQKFLPNINIRSERLLKLFGVTFSGATDSRNSKDLLYFLYPHQYILSTMINSVSYANFEDRIDFAFRMYDYDDDGKISKEDLKEMLTQYSQEGQFKLEATSIDKLVQVILQVMGRNQSDLITYEEFQGFFQRYQSKSVKVDVFERKKAMKATLNPYKSPGANPNSIEISNQHSDQSPTIRAEINESKAKTFLTNVRNRFHVDRAKWIWLALWIMGLIAYFVMTFIYFYNKTNLIQVGITKGSAAVISYNMGIMMALVTKSITTLLRKIGIAKILPLNFNVDFHTLLGFATLFFAWLHAIVHLSFVLPAISNMPLENLNKILLHTPDGKKTYTWWVLQSIPGTTGIASLILMTIMVVMAIKKLRNKNYERFWYTHALWFVLFGLLVMHGIRQYLASQHFYMWVSGPATVLVVEKLYALIVNIRKSYKILEISYLDSEVIELKVSKPENYKLISGQYARIKIPRISRLQWHPFSFSSSQNQDFLSFHISPVGDWTNQLKKLAIDYQNGKLQKLPNIYLMGPYGTPSQHYTDYKNIMIICSGVGATPFASILRDLSYKSQQNLEESLESKLVEFYWINKKPSNHVWLNGLFKELQSHEISKKVVRIHMYFTSPHQKYDMRSLLIWKGLEILNAEGIKLKGFEYFDFICWGRPDWNEIFARKAREVKRGVVGVFFCGNSSLAQDLHETCVKKSGNVKFNFCKEIF